MVADSRNRNDLKTKFNVKYVTCKSQVDLYIGWIQVKGALTLENRVTLVEIFRSSP